MGSITIKSSRLTASFNALGYVFDKYTVRNEGVFSILITTGNSPGQLQKLERIAILPQFEIMGHIVTADNWGADVLYFLSKRERSVSFFLEYQWGSMSIMRDSKNKRDYLMIDIDSLSPFVDTVFAGLFSSVGMEMKYCDNLPTSTGISISFRDMYQSRVMSISSPENNYEEADKICITLLEMLPFPLKIHIIFMDDYVEIRRLLKDKKVLPCKNCCGWHVGYGDIDSEFTNIDLIKKEELFDFVASEKCKENFFCIKNFTWIWEPGELPSVANGIKWQVTSGKQANIEVLGVNPIPGAMSSEVKDDIEKYIKNTLKSN